MNLASLLKACMSILQRPDASPGAGMQSTADASPPAPADFSLPGMTVVSGFWPESGATIRRMPATLSSRERAQLKARTHPLEPVVRIGHAGITPEVVAEVD